MHCEHKKNSSPGDHKKLLDDITRCHPVHSLLDDGHQTILYLRSYMQVSHRLLPSILHRKQYKPKHIFMIHISRYVHRPIHPWVKRERQCVDGERILHKRFMIIHMIGTLHKSNAASHYLRYSCFGSTIGLSWVRRFVTYRTGESIHVVINDINGNQVGFCVILIKC